VFGRILCHRYPPVSGSNVVAPEWYISPFNALRECHLPFQLDTVGSRSAACDRVPIGDASLVLGEPFVETVDIRHIGARKGIVDYAVRLVPQVTSASPRVVVDEGDELRVCAIAEQDESVFGLVICMTATRAECEVVGQSRWRISDVFVR